MEAVFHFTETKIFICAPVSNLEASYPLPPSPPLDVSAETLQGFVDGTEYLAETLAPTPSPTPAPETPAPIASDDPFPLESYYSSSEAASRISSDPRTPAPVVLPAIRVNVEAEAYDYCPRIPLSNLTIDWDGVESGDVRSLHASVYVSE